MLHCATNVVTPAAKQSAQYDEENESFSNRVFRIVQVVQKLKPTKEMRELPKYLSAMILCQLLVDTAHGRM